MIRSVGRVLVAVVFGAAASVGLAQQGAGDGIVVRDAWISEASTVQKGTGAFLVIENHTSSPVSLVSGDVPGVGVVELHTMKVENERMSMVPVKDIVVPANGSVELKPGSFHMMLFNLSTAFEPGSTSTVTLRFSNGVAKTVTAQVRKRGGTRQ
ncbi:MAG: copper chaperone PCu(A)C [Vicinamibacterales bacterium]